ncbi:hypothetical protein K1719_040818 [Acacia pycnantha]|nr:hypothetical protein K1719_040818 [Acacia pycnantha]
MEDVSWSTLDISDPRYLDEGDPIYKCQYRGALLWYNEKIKRFLRTLKNKIKNPRYVEGSIAEAFLVEEATKFASYYYPPEMISRWRGVPRSDDGGDTCNQNSIFNFPGRVVGKHWRSTLEGRDKQVAECFLPDATFTNFTFYVDGWNEIWLWFWVLANNIYYIYWCLTPFF